MITNQPKMHIYNLAMAYHAMIWGEGLLCSKIKTFTSKHTHQESAPSSPVPALLSILSTEKYQIFEKTWLYQSSEENGDCELVDSNEDDTKNYDSKDYNKKNEA